MRQNRWILCARTSNIVAGTVGGAGTIVSVVVAGTVGGVVAGIIIYDIAILCLLIDDTMVR